MKTFVAILKFEETKHPRDKEGQFAAAGGGGAGDYAKGIAESFEKAGQAQAAHEKERAAILDAYPEGAEIKLGKKTYTKQSIGKDTFWVGPKGGMTSRQFAIELGTRLKPHG